jgi:long-chain fatty acid transport protein
MVNYVDMNMSQGLLLYPKPFANYFRFEGNGWSAGANVGVLWQPVEEVSLGLTYRSPASVKLDGNAQMAFPGIPNSQTSANMELTFPMSVAFGVSWRPTPKWNLEFDASYTDWTSFDSTTIQQANPPAPFHKNVSVLFDWQASWMYSVGVTRYFDSGWNASAGFCFNENSVPNRYYTPLAADMDRYFFSAGTGWKGRHLSFDVAYQFGFGPDHTVDGSSPSSIPARNFTRQNADGKYSFYSNAISVSVGWHF